LQSGNTIQKMVEPLKTGELLVKEGLVHMDDIDMALAVQKKRQAAMGLKPHRFLGMILCDLNLVTPIDTFYVLHKYNKVHPVDEMLVSLELLSKQQVLNLRTVSTHRNIPFISALLKMGQLPLTTVQQLVFDLFHVPFRSVQGFVFDRQKMPFLTQVIDGLTAHQHQMLPLVLKDNIFLTGITEPESLLFLHQLRDRFPQYRFKAVFISSSGYERLFPVLYEKSEKPSIIPQATPTTPDLSLLMKFCVSISDPDNQTDAIQTLYHRYEQLCRLSGQHRPGNRQDDFNRFICESHADILRRYPARTIVFSLKKDDNGVKVVAQPGQ